MPTSTSIGMQLAIIPPGEFQMGHGNNTVDVTLTKPFRIGVYAVTQEQWKTVMEAEPWKGSRKVQEGELVAATHVIPTDVTLFFQRLSERDQASGKLREGWEYRLPTEAQWEWVCRAGTTTLYSFWDEVSELGEYAWYDANAKSANEDYVHVVGLKKPNPWSLRDVHGNVWEWCLDWHQNELLGGTDLLGPSEGTMRVSCGGAWYDLAMYCESARRSGNDPSKWVDYVGFRVVLAPVDP
jgi:formylglycine-generating enzyme required for sulfatase activity